MHFLKSVTSDQDLGNMHYVGERTTLKKLTICLKQKGSTDISYHLDSSL